MSFNYHTRAIITRSWVLTIHKDRIFDKTSLKDWVKNMQPAGYNGARTALTLLIELELWHFFSNSSGLIYVVSYLTIQSWTADCTLPTSTEMCIIRVEFWRFFDTREISLYKCETCVLQVNDFQKVFFLPFLHASLHQSVTKKSENRFFFLLFFWRFTRLYKSAR